MILIWNLILKSALHANLLADSQEMSVVVYTQFWGEQREEEKRYTLWTHTFSFQKWFGGISSEIRSYLKAQFAYRGS